METLRIEFTKEHRVPDTVSAPRLTDEILSFLFKYVDLKDRNSTLILNTTQLEDLKQQNNLNVLLGSQPKNIVNIKRINNIRRINKFFESVNECLPKGGIFIGCVETKAMRKKRIMARYPPVIRWIVYIADYIFKRIFPKVPLLKQLYFRVTQGKNRVITSVETLGRLYSCGYKVVDLQRTTDHLFFIARKEKEPDYNLAPSYGPLFRMKRVGCNGKCIYVYKLRTMHPYAEYLQEYIYEKNKLCDGGKINNDIRVTTVGKFCRKFWLDELPMLLNWLQGDIKLVGVRPISQHYLSLYDDELRQIREDVKPGLIPPFYADMPKTLEEIIDSEKRYIKAYAKAPLKTDVSYFLKACRNIIINKARSQ